MISADSVVGYLYWEDTPINQSIHHRFALKDTDCTDGNRTQNKEDDITEMTVPLMQVI